MSATIIKSPKTIFQSAKLMELYNSLPIPGILKITSMINDPESADGIAAVKMVIMGNRAFLRLCFFNVFSLSNPLAKAVRVYG